MEEEISLRELLAILKRHIGKIVVWILVGVILSGVYTFFFVVPTYQSTSKIVVNQTQNTSQTLTNTDIQTNLNLINTYQSIIKEPIILEDVLSKTNSDLTLSEISDKITIQTQNNSLVFGIAVQDENPYKAADLANAISSTFEEKIGNILEVESVTILSEAVPNLNAVSPNTLLNLIIGLFLGFISGISISLLSEYMDKRVKESKIIDDLGWTNLGSILEMSVGELKETRINKQLKQNNSVSPLSRRRV